MATVQLEHVVTINAPPEVVWNVTEDVERWPKWTPTVESVKRIDGAPFDTGSTALIKQPGLPEVKWEVTELTRGTTFTWTTRIRGMHMSASHEIMPDPAGTQSRLRLDVTGFVAVLLWPLIHGSARRALSRENLGLKNWCEQLVRENSNNQA